MNKPVFKLLIVALGLQLVASQFECSNDCCMSSLGDFVTFRDCERATTGEEPCQCTLCCDDPPKGQCERGVERGSGDETYFVYVVDDTLTPNDVSGFCNDDGDFELCDPAANEADGVNLSCSNWWSGRANAFRCNAEGDCVDCFEDSHCGTGQFCPNGVCEDDPNYVEDTGDVDNETGDVDTDATNPEGSLTPVLVGTGVLLVAVGGGFVYREKMIAMRSGSVDGMKKIPTSEAKPKGKSAEKKASKTKQKKEEKKMDMQTTASSVLTRAHLE